MSEKQFATMDDFDDLLNDLEGNIKNLDEDEDAPRKKEEVVEEVEEITITEEIPSSNQDFTSLPELEDNFKSVEIKEEIVEQPVEEVSFTSSGNEEETTYRFLMNGGGVHGGKVNDTCQFVIEIEDQATGRPCVLKSGEVIVEIRGSETINAQVIDQSSRSQGKFLVTYTPRRAGNYTIDIKWDNQSVLAQPNPAIMEDWAHPWRSVILGKPSKVPTNRKSSFQIEARDKNGNALQRGGDTFEVQVRGPDTPRDLRLLDHNTGLYTVEFMMVKPGKYQFTIEGRGEPMQGSPFDIMA